MAFDSVFTATAANADTTTVSNVVVPSGNPGLIAVISIKGTATVTSVVYNGSETFTQEITDINGNARVVILYLEDPTVTTADVVVTLSGNSRHVSTIGVYTGVDPTILVRTAESVSANGTDASPTVDVTTDADDIVVSGLSQVSAGPDSATADHDERSTVAATGGGTDTRSGLQDVISTGGTDTMGWSMGGSDNWATAAVALIPFDAAFVADLSTASFAMAGQDLATKADYDAALSSALFPMTGQDLLSNAQYQAALSTPTFAMVAQDLTAPFSFTGFLSAALFAMTGQDLATKADYDAALSAALFPMAGQDLVLNAQYQAALSAALFPMTPQPLEVPIAYVGSLSAPSFAMTPQNLDKMADVSHVLSSALFPLIAQDLDIPQGYVGELTAALFAMAPQDLSFNAEYDAALSAALFAMTPQDLLSNAQYQAALSAPTFAMAPQPLSLNAEYQAALSVPTFAMIAQPLQTPDGLVFDFTVASFNMTPQPLVLTAEDLALVTQQGRRQVAFRRISGVPAGDTTYNGDVMAACLADEPGITALTYNGILYEWLGLKGFTSDTLDERMHAFAANEGVYNWSSLGDFNL